MRPLGALAAVAASAVLLGLAGCGDGVQAAASCRAQGRTCGGRSGGRPARAHDRALRPRPPDPGGTGRRPARPARRARRRVHPRQRAGRDRDCEAAGCAHDRPRRGPMDRAGAEPRRRRRRHAPERRRGRPEPQLPLPMATARHPRLSPVLRPDTRSRSPSPEPPRSSSSASGRRSRSGSTSRKASSTCRAAAPA